MEIVSQPKISSSSNHATQNVGPSSPVCTPAPVKNTAVFAPVGIDPIIMRCPYCRTRILTEVEYGPSAETHFAALLLCVTGCWCCFYIPYCLNRCQNANHYCSNCHEYLGTGIDDNRC